MELRNLTVTRVTLVLALIGGLTLGIMQTSSVAHAGSGATISAAWTTRGLEVTGQGFTPGGSVLIQVDGGDITDLGGPLLDTVTATTDSTVACSPTYTCYIIPAGSVFDSFCGLDGSFDHTVSAYDFGTTRWSNTVTVPAAYTYIRTGC